MGSRLELHEELLTFVPKVHFQPPSGYKLEYPCIVYNRTEKSKSLANNGVYLSTQGYDIMVIDRNPDSTIADDIEKHFQHCTIDQYYTVDNLNHTTLSLFY